MMYLQKIMKFYPSKTLLLINLENVILKTTSQIYVYFKKVIISQTKNKRSSERSFVEH